MKKTNIKKLKLNINRQKILHFIKLLLIITMIILIYILSPKITNSIQVMAKYLYELDSNYITRIVELILAVSLVLPSILKNDKEEK